MRFNFVAALLLAALVPCGQVPAATIAVPCSVPALVNALNVANSNGEPDVINLATGCTYTLTSVDNSDFGDPNGLPVIATNEAVTIHGNGASLVRSTASGTPEFRLMLVRMEVAGGAGSNPLFALDNVTLRNGDVRTKRGSGGGIKIKQATFPPGAALLESVNILDSHAAIGGGLAAQVSTDIANSTFEGNQAGFYGGGVMAEAGRMQITSSRIIGNRQGSVDLLSEFGDSAYLISGGAGVGAFMAEYLTIVDSEISGNEGYGVGGGGIGVLATSGVMMNCRVHGNVLREPHNVDPSKGEMGSGGGIGIGNLSGATPVNFTIQDSAVYDNSADTSGGGIGIGGAVTAAVNNTTVADNHAGVRAGGVGDAANQVVMNNVTIAGNSAPRGAGVDIGSYTDSFGGTTIGAAWFINTAIGDNIGGTDCYNDGGSIPNNLGSLLETDAAGAKACDGASGKNFALRGDPGLSSFSDHGGPDPSMLPLPGSPLIDAGVSGWHGFSTDQRGACFMRVRGDGIDIGSIETGNEEVIFCASFDPTVVAN